MQDIITKEELFSYRVTGQIDIKDGQGQTQGQYLVGHVYSFTKEVGDNYVAFGLAEETDAPIGSKPDTKVETSKPADEAPVTGDAPVEAQVPPKEEVAEGSMPTQEEENHTIGIDPALEGSEQSVEIVHKTYRLLEDVDMLGGIQPAGSEFLMASEIGDELVKDGKAEEVTERE